VFANIFPTKIEKDLKALMQMGPELVFRYENNDTASVTVLMGVNRKNLVILGFSGTLAHAELLVTFLVNGARFETRVLRRGNDSRGNTLFYCSLPERIVPDRHFQRHRINGQGTAKILVTTNRGDKTSVLPVLEVSTSGLHLENKSGIQIKVGTKLFQTLVTVAGGASHLVDLQVAGVRAARGTVGERLVCAFTHEPRALTEMLSAARAVAPKPKPVKR